MVIYGEFLFLENFITGICITYFTVRIGGGAVRLLRLLLCGGLCGLYAFSIFSEIGGGIDLIFKIGFILLVSLAAFGKKPLKVLAANGILFFAVTVLYGGTASAFLTGFSWQGTAGPKGMYMPFATYLTVTCAAAAASLFVRLIVDIVKVKRQEARTKVEVTVCMGTEQLHLTGFIDSGNFLREPLSRKPVAVVKAEIMGKLLKAAPDAACRYTAIPYSAVGTEKGIMDGYRADTMVIGGMTIRNPVLAVCGNCDFPGGEYDRGQILLPESMLERGIYAEAK